MADAISEMKDTPAETVEAVEEQAGSEARAKTERDTLEEIDKRLRRELEARIRYFAQHPEEIDGRLEELDREWDMERLLMVNAGALSLMGMTFGVVHKRWHLLPAAMGVFLVQHATKGWCPPSSLLRRLGIRTIREVSRERHALKALRGDFRDVDAGGDNPDERARRAIEAADRNA